jgi:hypothetical protein
VPQSGPQDGNARWNWKFPAFKNAGAYSFAGSARKPFLMRRASVMTLRIAGSMDSLLKFMKQPQLGHWHC